MGGDVAEMTRIPSPPRGREEVSVQISRFLEAHKLIIQSCLDISEAADKAGDQGTNDLAISDILRPNELQSWFIGQHLVEMPLVLGELDPEKSAQEQNRISANSVTYTAQRKERPGCVSLTSSSHPTVGSRHLNNK
jgi:hypothetical protein